MVTLRGASQEPESGESLARFTPFKITDHLNIIYP